MANPNSNLDMGKLMSMLSNMDPDKLKQGIEQANQIMKSKDQKQILQDLQKAIQNQKQNPS